MDRFLDEQENLALLQTHPSNTPSAALTIQSSSRLQAHTVFSATPNQTSMSVGSTKHVDPLSTAPVVDGVTAIGFSNGISKPDQVAVNAAKVTCPPVVSDTVVSRNDSHISASTITAGDL